MSGVTIVGLQLQNYLYAGFWGWAVSNVTLTDNEIHGTTAATNSAGGILLVASPGATIANNYLHDLAYMGIVVSDNSAGGDSMGNTTVSGNVVVNACTWPAAPGGNDQDGGDCGGIYFWSQHPSTSTNMRIENNLVRDINVASMGAGDFGSCCAQGIYLDDGTNNVTVSGNVVTGITSACFQIHGGQDNILRGNLCDLGASGNGAIVQFQNDMLTPMTGNVFEDNIVVAASSGPGQGFVGVNTPPNPMTIQNNAYFNYVGSAVSSAGTGGAGSDGNPTYVNPGVSCWAPTLASGSPASSSPVSFPGIVSGWGPPGFALPKSGTAPSWPHGC
jgi:parallel beta-helix repeat protein